MLNLLNFLTPASPATTTISTDFCTEGSNTLFIFQVARLIIRVIQVAVPFVLIIFGSLDFFKAVVAGDEKEMKQKRKPFVQRVIAAVIILLLPSLVNLIMKNLAKSQNNRFATCWNNAGITNGIDIQNTGDDDTLDTN